MKHRFVVEVELLPPAESIITKPPVEWGVGMLANALQMASVPGVLVDARIVDCTQVGS